MFSRIARRYDLMNGLMTFGRDQAWRRLAARLARPAAGGVALDVATGTGDLATALMEEAGVSAVVGTDFSEKMLAVGKRKLRGSGIGDRIRLVAADALALPFPDKTFDCVTSAFLLRNLADLRQGLAEMRRVARAGGRVVALEIAQPTAPLFRPLFRWYFHRLVPRIGGLIARDRDAYTYLPRSVDRFPLPHEVAELMRKAGLSDVSFRRVGFGTITIHAGTA
jgi:demethylmenaquinone methyltransferase/2-methoxy-6-polyprenyl-1,4-benzoquinol methylase